MSLLKIEDLSVKFHKRQEGDGVVNHFSLELKRGEVTGLVGESGCGKTTAMRAVLGLLSPDAEVSVGYMEVEGEEILHGYHEMGGGCPEKIKKLRGRVISMVFQEPSAYLDPAMTVGRQLTETIREHFRCGRKEAGREACKLLNMVEISREKDIMKQYPFELSGGMCQRVSIALALACRPSVLIADEPVTALDEAIQGEILQLLWRIAKEKNMAVLLVSHDLHAVASICDRVLVMKAGSLIEAGSVEKVFRTPIHEYTKELLRCMRDLGQSSVRKTENKGEEILRLENVSKSYKVTEAVRDMNLTVLKGECYGIIGESGCGKTTLARMITGLLRPDFGEILYMGEPVVPLKTWGKNRHQEGIRMIFQNPLTALNPALTVEQMLTETLHAGGITDKEEMTKRYLAVLEKVGMGEAVLEKYPDEFSGGQRQRLALARALLGNPEFLVCDEPVSALDLPVQRQILNLLKEIQRIEEMTFLFISHDLHAVRFLCQRMCVMYLGTMVEEGNTEEIYRKPMHPYTRALLDAGRRTDPENASREWEAERSGSESKNMRENKSQGCPYAGKCPDAQDACYQKRPKLYSVGGRKVACYIYGTVEKEGATE
ncbi:MAG: dipeptide ABC transporter ATP-binding protein [Bariatricus sp.]